MQDKHLVGYVIGLQILIFEWAELQIQPNEVVVPLEIALLALKQHDFLLTLSFITLLLFHSVVSGLVNALLTSAFLLDRKRRVRSVIR